MSADKTSLIITYYYVDQDSVDMTLKCLDSLKYGMPDEVILVNDGTKSSKELIFYPNIRYYQRSDNGGYAACVNTGLSLATHDIIIVANNDIVFHPGWLEAIVKPLTLGYNISSIRTTDCDGWTTEDKITEGDKFGSLWAMQREVYKKLGGYDEELGKSSFEDTDYRRRALEAGFRVGKNHMALVEHLGRATMDSVYPNHEDFEIGKANYKRKWGEVD